MRTILKAYVDGGVPLVGYYEAGKIYATRGAYLSQMENFVIEIGIAIKNSAVLLRLKALHPSGIVEFVRSSDHNDNCPSIFINEESVVFFEGIETGH